MLNIVNYFEQFIPSLDRSNTKYYSEMQQLAYNLVKYLSMNEDKNEHSCQGNYNLTYLRENMIDDDFKMIANMFLRRIPMGEVRQMIKGYWSEEGANIVLKDDNELRNNYNDLADKYTKLKEEYNCFRENLKDFIKDYEN